MGILRRVKIYTDFMRGLTIVGLARKYGMKTRQVENHLRSVMKSFLILCLAVLGGCATSKNSTDELFEKMLLDTAWPSECKQYDTNKACMDKFEENLKKLRTEE